MIQNNERYIQDGKLSFLTPKVMVVLEFFMNDPLNEYHEREVVRRTSVSLGSANKILRLLAELDFLTRTERGRLAIYKLKQKEPAVRQFKVLLNTFTLKTLKDELKNISRRVVLFGSCSQGTDAKESDIDLLVVTDEKEQVGKIISDYNKKSKRKISSITVDMNGYVQMKREDKPLYENIEAGIVLWETE